jgi:hypothetical protein
VPPPPVGGGPVGTALGEDTGVCEGGALVCVGGALVCVGGALVCSDGGFVDGCDAAASGGLVVDVCVGVAGWLAPAGDEPAGLVPAGAVGEGGLLEVEEPEHADTETETTTVKVAHAAK